MILEIVKNYGHLKKSIPSLIKAAGYRNDFIAKKMNISPSYFAVKKQRSNWTDEEMIKLAEILENDDVIGYYEALLIKKNKTNKAVSSDDFEKIMGW